MSHTVSELAKSHLFTLVAYCRGQSTHPCLVVVTEDGRALARLQLRNVLHNV